jgi:hypothetical protein
MDGLVDLSVVELREEAEVPKGIGALALLQMAYRKEVELSAQQMRAAIEALPFEAPKLTAVAHFEGSFAEALEQAIERRGNRPPPSLLIEAKPVEPLPAEGMKKPFPRLRRRV